MQETENRNLVVATTRRGHEGWRRRFHRKALR
jgi:hypothetical protein